MMGKSILLLFSLFVSLTSFGQYYKVTVKTMAEKTNYPDATFMLEEGATQMKGFEGKINSIGFGGEGLKPVSLVEKEYKEKLALEMEEKLKVPVQDKLDEKLLKLEMNMKNLEFKLNSKEREQIAKKSANGRNGGKKAAGTMGTMRPDNKNYRYLEAYTKAKSEYETFKQDYERAKRNMNVKATLVKEIDSEVKEYYEKLLVRPVSTDGSYPFGTFCMIKIQKVAENKVKFDFDYAICRILGWLDTEGNNNNNIMNSCLDLEYIEMPSKVGAIAELGKTYCFQIARPEKRLGSLKEAQNNTTIFSDNARPTSETAGAGLVKSKNPLDADGNFVEIRTKFKGHEREVVRVLVTISKGA